MRWVVWCSLVAAQCCGQVLDCTNTIHTELVEPSLWLAQTLSPSPSCLFRVLVPTSNTTLYSFSQDTATLQLYGEPDDAWTTIHDRNWSVINTLLEYAIHTGDRNFSSVDHGATTSEFILQITANIPVVCGGHVVQRLPLVLPDRPIQNPIDIPNDAVCELLQAHHATFKGQITTNEFLTMPKHFFLSAPTYIYEMGNLQGSMPTMLDQYVRHAAHFARDDTLFIANTTFWYRSTVTPTKLLQVAVFDDGRIVDGKVVHVNQPIVCDYRYCDYLFTAPCKAAAVEEPSKTYLFDETTDLVPSLERNWPLLDTGLFRTPFAGMTYTTTTTTTTTRVNNRHAISNVTWCTLPRCDVTTARFASKLEKLNHNQIAARLVALDNSTTRYMFDNDPAGGYNWTTINSSAGLRITPIIDLLPTSSNVLLDRIRLPCGYTTYSTTPTTLYRNATAVVLGNTNRIRFVQPSSVVGPSIGAFPTYNVNGSGFYNYGSGTVYLVRTNSVIEIVSIEFALSTLAAVWNKTAPVLTVATSTPSQILQADIGTVVFHHCLPGHGVYRTRHVAVNASYWTQLVEDVHLVNDTNVECAHARQTNHYNSGLDAYVRSTQLANPTSLVTAKSCLCRVNNTDNITSYMATLQAYMVVPTKPAHQIHIDTIWLAPTTPSSNPTCIYIPPSLSTSPKTWTTHVFAESHIAAGRVAVATCTQNNVRVVVGSTSSSSSSSSSSNLAGQPYDGGPCDQLVYTSNSPFVGILSGNTTRMLNLDLTVCSGAHRIVVEPPVIRVQAKVNESRYPQHTNIQPNGTTTADDATTHNYPSAIPDNTSETVCFYPQGQRYIQSYGTIVARLEFMYDTLAHHQRLTTLYSASIGLLVHLREETGSETTYFQRALSEVPLLNHASDFYNTASNDSCSVASITGPSIYHPSISTSQWSRRGAYNNTANNDTITAVTPCTSLYTDVAVPRTLTSDQTCGPVRDASLAVPSYWVHKGTRRIAIADYEVYNHNTSADDLVDSLANIGNGSIGWAPTDLYTIKAAALSAFIDYVVDKPKKGPTKRWVVAPSLVDIATPTTATEYRLTLGNSPGFLAMPRAHYLHSQPLDDTYTLGYSNITTIFERRYQARIDNVTNRLFLFNLSWILEPHYNVTKTVVSIPLGSYGRTTISRNDTGRRLAHPVHCAMGTHYKHQTTGACVAHTQCDSGYEFEAAPPTLYSDRICARQQFCGPTMHESTRATATTDRVCSFHPVCDLSFQYVAKAATSTSPRACRTTATKCNHGYYLSPQQNVIDPDIIDVSSGCVPCDKGYTSFRYENGTETFGTTHTFRSCMLVDDLVLPKMPGFYYSRPKFLATDGSTSPTEFLTPCRVCSVNEREVVPCAGTTNRVCNLDKSTVSTTTSSPTTSCLPHQYFNVINGRCSKCTKCAHNAYRQRCTDGKDAICTVNGNWKFIHTAVLMLTSIWYFVMLYLTSPKTSVRFILAVKNALGPSTRTNQSPLAPVSASDPNPSLLGRIGASVVSLLSWPHRVFQQIMESRLEQEPNHQSRHWLKRVEQAAVAFIMWPARVIRGFQRRKGYTKVADNAA